MDIGKNIERLRKAKGMSRSKLSFRCFVSENHIYTIESGRSQNITLNNLKKIADALEVDLIELLKEPKAA